MGKVWFFSPVGGTDPMSQSNLRDGSMIHIARHYRPDVIYLYLSKEMLEHQERDDRYRYTLKKLFELQGREGVIVEEIMRPDLVEVQDFNTFFREFRPILQDIRQKMEPTDIL